MPVTPPIIGPDIRQYARQLNKFLSLNLGKLFFKTSDDNPSTDGIFLWDDTNSYPVVSHNNAFRQIAMKHATPPANTGSVGDVTGMISWDANYIYICVANYDGSTAIWKRVALSTW
tara:strand:- start:100 stop:447 length:348 start_codon:yes stop_codon:yes gene_type:complete